MALRKKLREAYSKNCTDYESLLDTVTAIDEELLFACSPSRLDYFKSAIDFDSRLKVKRQQLSGQHISLANLDRKRTLDEMPSLLNNGSLENGLKESTSVEGLSTLANASTSTQHNGTTNKRHKTEK